LDIFYHKALIIRRNLPKRNLNERFQGYHAEDIFVAIYQRGI